MSVSIDLYEFREVVLKSPGKEALDWLLDNHESKAAYVVHMGDEGMPRELVEAFRAHGCEGEGAVLVVVQ